MGKEGRGRKAAGGRAGGGGGGGRRGKGRARRPRGFPASRDRCSPRSLVLSLARPLLVLLPAWLAQPRRPAPAGRASSRPPGRRYAGPLPSAPPPPSTQIPTPQPEPRSRRRRRRHTAPARPRETSGRGSRPAPPRSHSPLRLSLLPLRQSQQPTSRRGPAHPRPGSSRLGSRWGKGAWRPSRALAGPPARDVSSAPPGRRLYGAACASRGPRRTRRHSDKKTAARGPGRVRAEAGRRRRAFRLRSQ